MLDLCSLTIAQIACGRLSGTPSEFEHDSSECLEPRSSSPISFHAFQYYINYFITVAQGAFIIVAQGAFITVARGAFIILYCLGCAMFMLSGHV